ncbi:MAG: TIGR02391 family protein [Thaumarchaeota archaeon]|nr:TIGR02391 family protein [Nitrososphaerota archaeon]
MADIKFLLPAIEHLSRAIGEAHSGEEITALFRRAGFGSVAYDGGARSMFLYAALERLQRDVGAGAILDVLKAACGPDAPRRDGVRCKVNECLCFYGLRMDDGGELHRTEAGRADPDGGREAFMQRNYHRIVTDAARAGFLQGDYFQAVRDSCREFERLVRGKSGLEMSGKELMARALDPKAGLEISLPLSASMTRDSVQEGIMHMCVGIMASAMHPTAHETRRSFPIGRDEALDMLGVISHLCRQIDRMGPRARG